MSSLINPLTLDQLDRPAPTVGWLPARAEPFAKDTSEALDPF
jgi:hypothetical protein